MSTGQEGDYRGLDSGFLAKDNPPDFLAGLLQALSQYINAPRRPFCLFARTLEFCRHHYHLF
jgi:hypothetical protein